MKKIFTLLFAAMGLSAMADNTVTVKYDFENYKKVASDSQTDKFYTWFEKDSEGNELMIWGTGNNGYNLAKLFSGGAKEGDFPTEADENGRTGACVKLETKDTYTAFSPKTPIAAGNIFLGSFNLDISNPLASTKFGIVYDKKPVSFSFYYKYQAGATLKDMNRTEVAGKTDKGNAYAVLYDNNGGSFQADGSNVLTNENVVGVANAGELDNTGEWTQKVVTFEYSKDVDKEKLAAGGYNLALVFTSSIDGAAFQGAVGSTMYVDDVELVCESAEAGQESTVTYNDNLKITLKSEGSEPTVINKKDAQVIVTTQADGKYTFTLKNFVLDMGESNSMPVGTINIKDLEGTKTESGISLKTSKTAAEIVDGDDKNVGWMAASLMEMFKDEGGVPVSLDALMTSEKLYAELSIPLGFMNVDVVFGGEDTPTDINGVVSGGNTAVTSIYTIDGKQVSAPGKSGVYIIRKADGTSVKVIRK